MRTLWPGYTNPTDDEEWGQAIGALRAEDIAVMNPADGPGREMDVAWVHRINQLHAKGVLVGGYVATGYSGRDWRVCVAEAGRYRSLGYSIDLIFWDEVAGFEPLGALKGLHGYSRSLMPRGTGWSVFNLGKAHTDNSKAIARVLTGSIWVTFESPATMYPISDRSGEAHLVYGAGPGIAAAVRREAERDGIGWMYTTADTLPNPWDTWDG
jgi:hypothetical protein